MAQAPDNYLPSVIPELKTFGLTIDFSPGLPVAVPGNFIVSVGKNRKPGSVYQVIERRFVKSKKYPYRYAFRVVKCPELIKDVHINFRFEARIHGHSEPAFTLTWYKRDKKKSPITKSI